ncbi:hypothetical protein P691DRAFT_780731 [Macrolepiota fuliginosa MF-IS2]|uniref:Uncharacterized protein n=1 Tax=Macrolepiota fuliginosa MF-IS2 TaxID=1400762 RepID=A0A9P5X0F0_9AGAR|nr:hypothetical protein P691DRAFT_780731 [Macrolepiota fuliginosa MF-IS2]
MDPHQIIDSLVQGHPIASVRLETPKQHNQQPAEDEEEQARAGSNEKLRKEKKALECKLLSCSRKDNRWGPEGKPMAGGWLFQKYLVERCQDNFKRCWLAKDWDVCIWMKELIRRKSKSWTLYAVHFQDAIEPHEQGWVAGKGPAQEEEHLQQQINVSSGGS